jgi:hypothetical protein
MTRHGPVTKLTQVALDYDIMTGGAHAARFRPQATTTASAYRAELGRFVSSRGGELGRRRTPAFAP